MMAAAAAAGGARAVVVVAALLDVAALRAVPVELLRLVDAFAAAVEVRGALRGGGGDRVAL